jgi:hypothetical protein
MGEPRLDDGREPLEVGMLAASALHRRPRDLVHLGRPPVRDRRRLRGSHPEMLREPSDIKPGA